MVALANPGDRIKALQDERATLVAEMETAFNAGENETFDAKAKEVDAKDSEIDKATQMLQALEKRSNAQGQPKATSTDPQIGRVRDAWQDDPKLGYASHRDFLMDVMSAYRSGKANTPQLRFLAAAGSDEQSTINDSYGGFLVPEAFSPNMLSVGMEMDPTSALVTDIPMSSPVVNIPARTDKDHSSSVSGGLTVSRTTETQGISASRMQVENVKLEATAQTGLAYATEQLLNSSVVSFAALIDAGFRDEFSSSMLDEKLNGNGAGEPVGIINAACTISVAKEGSQTADTINGTNLINMRERAWRYGRSIWMANHDCYTNLLQCHVSLTNDDVPLFRPGNGVDVPDTLLGRPIYFTEYTKTIGDKGDIILADWSQYLWGTQGSTTPERAESIHVRFSNNERTFRFVVYNTGAPWWKSALTPQNGANTLSPFVVLAERA